MMNDELPENEAAFEAMKAALYKRAVGYTYEQVIVTDGPHGTTTTTKTVDVPGDVKAMEKYIQLFGG